MRLQLAIDANLLVLLVVGATTPEYISKHKKLRGEFRPSDYELLRETIANSAGVVATPHVLAETSNLLAYVGEPVKSEIFLTFRALIAEIREAYIDSSRAAMRSEFPRVGLADAALLELCDNGAALITCDTGLWLAALNVGIEALHFNHLRDCQ